MANYIIGLTGGIGSGKTAVSDRFKALGIDIIDADVVAREIVAPNSQALAKIKEKFGNNIVLSNGNLDRAKLRKKIFSNELDKQWLNSLLHPLIRTQILELINNAKSPYCILVAPLLLENKLHHLVNRVLVIDTSAKTQLTRTMQRDNNSEQQVQAIIDSQISRENRLELADDVLLNEHISLRDLDLQVAKLHQKYLNLSKKAEI